MAEATTASSAAFAVEAARHVAHGDAAAAVRLCADGIRSFPDYLGGYIVLARAYDALGHADDARTIRLEAQRAFPWLPHVGPLQVAQPEPQPVEHVEEPSVEHVEEPPVEHVEEARPEPTLEEPAGLTLITTTAPEHPAVAHPSHDGAGRHTLRIIDTAKLVDDQRIIRSATVRLIPGLEFTSLRFEGVKQRGRRAIQHLSDPPPYRDFHAPMKPYQRPTSTSTAPLPSRKRPLSLEELASRLERVRMPRPGETASEPVGPPASGTTLVTETIARIYESQGAFDLAIEAYRTLQRQRPDKHEHYQALIDAVMAKRTT